MLDEYAVLRWETEGGASRDRSEPLQENREAAKDEAVRMDRAEEPGTPTGPPAAAAGQALRLTARFG
jgi:hypothetical protein